MLKARWRRWRRRLRRRPLARSAVSRLIAAYLRLVHRTSRLAPGSVAPGSVMTGEPVIIALWHGRHFMVPLHSPPGVPVTALVSRSADAELNAAVLERFGVDCVRGSGGRGEAARMAEKGGMAAFRALYAALGEGRTVVMIADRKPCPREAQAGIVRLARAADVPIVPVAYASSRGRAFSRAWDRAVLPLPFGRAAIVAGEPIRVGDDPGDGAGDDPEAARLALTAALDEATARAERLAGTPARLVQAPAIGWEARV